MTTKAQKKSFEQATYEKDLATAQMKKVRMELIAKRDERVLFYLNENLRSTRVRRRGWTTPAEPERDFNMRDQRTSMAKVRQKAEESPVFAGMIKRLTDNIVGSGFRLIMTTKNKEFNKETETRWKIKKDKQDIRGQRRFGRLQRAWWDRSRMDGDVGIVKVDGGTVDGQVLSYAQTIEADRIFKDLMLPNDYGIDYNVVGRAMRYYVGPRRMTKTGVLNRRFKGKPIPANKFIFYPHFPHERIERKRGVSLFLQSLNLIEDFEQIIENMKQKVKNEAFIGLNFKMEAAPDGSLFGTDIEEVKTAEDGKQRRHVKMAAGMNITSEEGEKVEVLESKSPNQQFDPFTRMLVRFMGAPVGLPLEMLLMDFSGINYSSGRGLMKMAEKGFRVEQDDLAYVTSDYFTWWLSRETKHNGLEIPADIKDTFWAHRWGKPGWPYLDPLKEMRANGEALDRGLISHQEILAQTGDMDFDETTDQLAEEYEIMRKKDIPIISGLPGSNVLNGDDKNEGEE